MIIRDLKMSELEWAVNLKYECWIEDFETFLPKESMNREKELAHIIEWMSDKDAEDIRRMLGVFEGEELVGYAGASFAEPEDSDYGVELNYLFVKKEYRGKAIGMKLLKMVVNEFKEYGKSELIVYNWHESESNKFYRNLGGELVKQIIQKVSGQEALVDVFRWSTIELDCKLKDILQKRKVTEGGYEISLLLDSGFSISSTASDEDTRLVCNGLYSHNIIETNGLLKRPAISINLYLRKNEKVIGAILCDTFNFCLYIDVMWIEDRYRGKGLGRKLIEQAEEIARENGCVFAHTCTFNYQSPEFYKSCGYSVFGVLDDYPDGITQIFLKKKL